MSKITNDDGLTRSGIGFIVSVPIWQQMVKTGVFDRLSRASDFLKTGKPYKLLIYCKRRRKRSN